MFYCDIKRAHYWRGKEVVTRNSLLLFFENYEVMLTLLHHARGVRGTQNKMEKSPFWQERGALSRHGWDMKATLVKHSFLLGSEDGDKGEPREEK